MGQNFQRIMLKIWIVNMFFPLVELLGGLAPPPPICTTINVLVIRVMHNKFDQNQAKTFWEDVENVNFPFITLYMTMLTLTPKCVTYFSTAPVDLYNFDNCPDVSKYLNDFKALGTLVSEKKIFEVWPNLTCFCTLVPPPLIWTTLEALVLRAMHTMFGQNWPRNFRGDVENMNSNKWQTK